MSADGNLQTVKAVQRRILSLLDDMPVESLVTVEQFARFMREQAQLRTVSAEQQHLYAYPTVALPPSSLDRWVNLIPGGYAGDALRDTEALYDEV